MYQAMPTTRRIALVLLLTAVFTLLALTFEQFWSYRHAQADLAPFAGSSFDPQVKALQDRVEILTKRVAGMELLALLLLASLGLYAVVFVVSSYFNTLSFARQADRSIAAIKDQLGVAIAELRQQKEGAERRIHEETAAAASNLEKLREEVRTAIGQEIDRLEAAAAARPAETAPRDHAGESTLAILYLDFARISDQERAGWYLDRALELAGSDTRLIAEIQYDRACRFAVNRDLPRAAESLTTALQNPSRDLDDRLARDTEPGGALYDLANTPPYDKALDDLLLNVSIGSV